jgi:NADH dehydrogenase
MILVTGGSGFVGPKIVHALRAQNHDVRCLVRSSRRASRLADWGCELVEGDMTDAASLRRAVTGCDTVVHLVAIIAGKPSDFERVMTKGTRDLVAAARDARVRRFVLMSALGTGEETKELTSYFAAKWAMEREVKGSGIEHVVFRPSFVFGRDGGVLPTFVKLVRYTPVIPVIGPGTQRLQPIWVEDVAQFFARAIETGSGTYELGGPEAVTWDELYDRIAAVLGKRRAKVHVPFGLVRANATVLEALPGPTPVTRDQLTMLERSGQTCDVQPAVATFGVDLTSLDEQLRRAA